MKGSKSFARNIIEEFIDLPKFEIAIEIPMTVNRLPAQRAYDAAAQEISSHLNMGKNVVFLCEGDPFFYGSFMYLHSRLYKKYLVEIVPGVSSMTACAAMAKKPLAARNEVLTVLPGPLSKKELERRLADNNSSAIMKVGRHIKKIKSVIDRLGLMDSSLYIERASLKEQRILKLID